MEPTKRSRLQRTLILGIVTGLHGAVLAWLLMASNAGNPERATPPPVTVVPLPPVETPRVRTESAPTRPLRGILVQALPPRALGELPMGAAPAASTEANGAGVDWRAEARRALHAYEIRNSRPPANTSVSGESEDEWVRQLAHHAGDQVRTRTGDWIIWISTDCYQIAKAGSNADGASGPAPPVYCVERSRTVNDAG